MDGSVADLRSRSSHVRVEATVDGVPWVPAEDDYAAIARDVRGGAFLVSNQLHMDDVLAHAESAGRVTSFSYGPPHLSDLFREAVTNA